MALKHLNVGARAAPIPVDWTPDKRFISYEYAPATFDEPRLPQSPQRNPEGGEDVKQAIRGMGRHKTAVSPSRHG